MGSTNERDLLLCRPTRNRAGLVIFALQSCHTGKGDLADVPPARNGYGMVRIVDVPVFVDSGDMIPVVSKARRGNPTPSTDHVIQTSTLQTRIGKLRIQRIGGLLRLERMSARKGYRESAASNQMIDLPVHVIVVIRSQSRADPETQQRVRGKGLVWNREPVEEELRLRDRQGGKHRVAKQRSGERGIDCNRGPLPVTFIGHKEKCLVFPDRAADRTAELVPH